MIHDYMIIFLALLIAAYILIFLCECIFDAKWVNYSLDEELATVFITRLVGNRYNFSVRDLDFTFEKSENGKWKYIADFSDLKKRIIAFVIIFLTCYFFYGYLAGTWIPTFWNILQCTVVGAFSFITMITDPIEAYITLMIDLHKKDRGE